MNNFITWFDKSWQKVNNKYSQSILNHFFRKQKELEEEERERKKEERLRKREQKLREREERKNLKKVRRQQEEEQKKLQMKIALEERRLLLAQRNLESIRLIAELLARAKVSIYTMQHYTHLNKYSAVPDNVPAECCVLLLNPNSLINI